MDLHQEKFRDAKELSEIQMQLSTARATLDALKDEEQSYLAAREERVRELVKEVVADCKGALAEAHATFDELREYSVGVRNFAQRAQALYEAAITFARDFMAWAKREDEALEAKRAELSAITEQQAAERAAIRTERQQIEKDQQHIADQTRLMHDRRHQLNLAFGELQDKQLDH
jgi:hypothetical protein